eukprot:1722481-Rhodomonas_salina.2
MIPMSSKYSIRSAIKESNQAIRVVMDIITPHMKPAPKRSKMAAVDRTMIDAIQGNMKLHIQINDSCNQDFVAMMGALQVISMQKIYSFKATVLSPEPKTQHEARGHSDAQDWIDSEWIEMETVYKMGTLQYVH